MWHRGILWGVETPDGVQLHDDDSQGLLDRWCAVCAPVIAEAEAAMAQEYPHDLWMCKASHLYVPWQDATCWVLGMIVVDDSPFLHGVPVLGTKPIFLGEIETAEMYSTSLRRARDRWAEFAAWSATQGVAFPSPRLWLASTKGCTGDGSE